jgi:hypothetical protein
MNPLHVAAITLGVFLIGCSKPQQALTPADEKLVPVYADLLVMSEDFRSPKTTIDSARYQSEVQSLLTKNALTKEEFSNRLRALAQLPDVFQQFQTKVYSELEHRRSKRSS